MQDLHIFRNTDGRANSFQIKSESNSSFIIMKVSKGKASRVITPPTVPIPLVILVVPARMGQTVRNLPNRSAS